MDIKVWILSGVLTMAGALGFFLFKVLVTRIDKNTSSVNQLITKLTLSEERYSAQMSLNKLYEKQINALFKQVKEIRETQLQCINKEFKK